MELAGPLGGGTCKAAARPEQGNAAFYTEENIQRRLQLKKSERVRQSISLWWNLIPKDSENHVNKPAYLEMTQAIQYALKMKLVGKPVGCTTSPRMIEGLGPRSLGVVLPPLENQPGGRQYVEAKDPGNLSELLLSESKAAVRMVGLKAIAKRKLTTLVKGIAKGVKAMRITAALFEAGKQHQSDVSRLRTQGAAQVKVEFENAATLDATPFWGGRTCKAAARPVRVEPAGPLGGRTGKAAARPGGDSCKAAARPVRVEPAGPLGGRTGKAAARP
eukprot:gene30339-37911_t